MNPRKGSLYVVATPIGNLDDLSRRALDTLSACNLIAAEDTRHTLKLLQHYGIHRPLVSLHEHNELSRVALLAAHLARGEDVALVSDAGTPLISDPGARLCQALAEQGFTLGPIPGPCAAISALSVSGLACDQWVFLGFLPAKKKARQEVLVDWVRARQTLVLYEAPHRILALLEDVVTTFGPERRIALARELTKRFETLLRGSAAEVAARVQADPDQQRGEMVLMIEADPAAASPQESADRPDTSTMIRVLNAYLPPGRVAAAVAEMTGLSRKTLYQQVLAQRDS